MTDRRWRTLAGLALLLAAAYFVVRGPFWPSRTRLWDYAVFASASELWVRGQDPYDTALVTQNWASAPPGLGIEPHVGWVRSNAPPTTLAVLAPFSLFGRTGGAAVYLLSTSVLTGYAAWRIARWTDVRGVALIFCAAGLLASTPLIAGTRSGNPVMLAAPLALLAFERGRRTKGPLAGVMLGVAAAAKVQLGVPLIALALAWRPFRRTGLLAAVVLTGIALVGVGRLTAAGVDWRPGLLANVAETNGPGGMNDFALLAGSLDDHLELQTPVWRTVRSRAAANGIAWGVVLATALAAVLVARRRPAPSHLPLLLGIAAGLTLLPIYHRTYDALVALPLIAAAVAGLREPDRRVRRLSLAILLLSAAFLVPLGFARIAEQHLGLGRLRDNLLYRSLVVTPRPWALLAMLWLAILRLRRVPIDVDARPHRPEKSLPQTQAT